MDAGFNKMVPLKHPYMQVYRDYQKDFGSANRVAIALVQKDGDIFNKEYMQKLKGLTDDVFLLNGVDRPSVKSLFTPNTRFIEVIEEGFAGGNVIPATFQGTDEDLKTVREQRATSPPRSAARVATDFTGALVSAALLEIDPQTNQRLNYFEVAAQARGAAREVRERQAQRAHHRLRQGDRRHPRRRARRGHVLRHRLRDHAGAHALVREGREAHRSWRSSWR